MDWVTIVASVVLALVVDELLQWSPRLALWIVKKSTLLVPTHLRERYEEEWAAHLESIPGKISRIVVALGTLQAGIVLRIEQTSRSGKNGAFNSVRRSALNDLYEELEAGLAGGTELSRDTDDLEKLIKSLNEAIVLTGETPLKQDQRELMIQKLSEDFVCLMGLLDDRHVRHLSSLGVYTASQLMDMFAMAAHRLGQLLSRAHHQVYEDEKAGLVKRLYYYLANTDLPTVPRALEKEL